MTQFGAGSHGFNGSHAPASPAPLLAFAPPLDVEDAPPEDEPADDDEPPAWPDVPEDTPLLSAVTSSPPHPATYTRATAMIPVVRSTPRTYAHRTRAARDGRL